MRMLTRRALARAPPKTRLRAVSSSFLSSLGLLYLLGHSEGHGVVTWNAASPTTSFWPVLLAVSKFRPLRSSRCWLFFLFNNVSRSVVVVSVSARRASRGSAAASTSGWPSRRDDPRPRGGHSLLTRSTAALSPMPMHLISTSSLGSSPVNSCCCCCLLAFSSRLWIHTRFIIFGTMLYCVMATGSVLLGVFFGLFPFGSMLSGLIENYYFLGMYVCVRLCPG